MSAVLTSSASAERNKEPILSVLREVLPRSGTVLEIASGTGQHVVHFAAALPALIWQPSDPGAQQRQSIAARIAAAHLPNVREPIALDVHDPRWSADAFDAIVCINMLHVSAWSAAVALLRGARAHLRPGGTLFLYGPYREQGAHTAPSNEAFDRSLRMQNAAWGVRDLDEVTALAAEHGFARTRVTRMPANNLSVAFVN